jgi:hypothetical protein
VVALGGRRSWALVGGFELIALVTRGHSINRARKTVIWLGAVLVALAVVPCLLHPVQRLGAGADLFWLVRYSDQGSVFFTLPTDLFPADRVATVWGVFGAVGVWVGACWVCWQAS